MITIVRALERSRTPYMLTGSLVSSFHGEPRATHDVDFVVLLGTESAGLLAAALSKTPYYAAPETVMRAVEGRTMFNVIDPESGIKVDFWLLTEEPFDQSRFARRYQERLLGMDIWVSTAEDTILAKLRWAKLAGGSEKHLTDALRVYEVQHGRLDHVYLEQWVSRLAVDELWRLLLSEARPLE